MSNERLDKAKGALARRIVESDRIVDQYPGPTACIACCKPVEPLNMEPYRLPGWFIEQLCPGCMVLEDDDE